MKPSFAPLKQFKNNLMKRLRQDVASQPTSTCSTPPSSLAGVTPPVQFSVRQEWVAKQIKRKKTPRP